MTCIYVLTYLAPLIFTFKPLILHSSLGRKNSIVYLYALLLRGGKPVRNISEHRILRFSLETVRSSKIHFKAISCNKSVTLKVFLTVKFNPTSVHSSYLQLMLILQCQRRNIDYQWESLNTNGKKT